MNSMNKAAVAPLVGLVLLLVPAVFAQTPAEVQQAIDEGVRREAHTIDLHKKLADAQAAQKKGDNFEAAKLYTDCVTLIRKIGGGVENEQQQVRDGVVVVRLILAEQAQRG